MDIRYVMHLLIEWKRNQKRFIYVPDYLFVYFVPTFTV